VSRGKHWIPGTNTDISLTTVRGVNVCLHGLPYSNRVSAGELIEESLCFLDSVLCVGGRQNSIHVVISIPPFPAQTGQILPELPYGFGGSILQIPLKRLMEDLARALDTGLPTRFLRTVGKSNSARFKEACIVRPTHGAAIGCLVGASTL